MIRILCCCVVLFGSVNVAKACAPFLEQQQAVMQEALEKTRRATRLLNRDLSDPRRYVFAPSDPGRKYTTSKAGDASFIRLELKNLHSRIRLYMEYRQKLEQAKSEMCGAAELGKDEREAIITRIFSGMYWLDCPTLFQMPCQRRAFDVQFLVSNLDATAPQEGDTNTAANAAGTETPDPVASRRSSSGPDAGTTSAAAGDAQAQPGSSSQSASAPGQRSPKDYAAALTRTLAMFDQVLNPPRSNAPAQGQGPQSRAPVGGQGWTNPCWEKVQTAVATRVEQAHGQNPEGQCPSAKAAYDLYKGLYEQSRSCSMPQEGRDELLALIRQSARIRDLTCYG